ncbi:unnamed protein product [Adineta steineri]|uniref:EF-hand domain-containing protein n=1 Tax=Adineta steineri TaxID=433720 RepID=A0A814GSQ5_9BILA|nr:unnamed protein product [Adineta steineri]
MENLATITQADINNGALIRMINKAGIPDIQEYIKHFHQETEELIIEEFEHPNADKLDNDEQIVPPADIQSWITGFRPNVDDPIKPVLFEQEQQPKPQPPLPKDIQGWLTGLGPRLDDHNKLPSSEQEQQPKPQPPLPKDIQGWITGLGPRLDDHNKPPSSEQEQQPKPQPPLPKDIQGWITRLQPRPDDPIQPPLPQQQQSQEIPLPKDLQSWLHRMGPSNVHSSTETTIDTTEITTINNDINPANGDLGSTVQNAQKMYAVYKQFDKNGDGKITVEDIELYLQEMGLGFVSPYVAKGLFQAVDQNHNGTLDFTDLMALTAILNKLNGQFGGA